MVADEPEIVVLLHDVAGSVHAVFLDDFSHIAKPR